eukprot:3477873-Rhodomonas_salina.5
MPGTNDGYAGTRQVCAGTALLHDEAGQPVARAIRTCYAMSGTDLAYLGSCAGACAGGGALRRAAYDGCDVRYWHSV